VVVSAMQASRSVSTPITFFVVIHDRQDSAVALPHESPGGSQIGFGMATGNGLRHQFANLHAMDSAIRRPFAQPSPLARVGFPAG